MEDFFEKILTEPNGPDEAYIRSEANRLRAYLYTLRDEDRQREIERLQTDLTYWHLVMSYKEVNFDYGLFEYALYLLADLKKGFGLDDTEELSKLLDLAQEFNFVECGRTIADLPNKDKVCEILYIIERADKVRFSVYRDFALINSGPSMQEDEEPKEEQPQTQSRELPKELRGAKAKNRLKAAQKLKLLDENYYWIESKDNTLTLCAFFCACLNASCDIHAKAPTEEGGKDRNEWKLYEGFFFENGKYEGRKVNLSNNFGNLRSKGRKTLNEGNYREILDFCDVPLSKILPLKTNR